MSYQELEAGGNATIASKFESYEAYLDSFINKTDLEYLENIDVARQLVELGINVKTQILSREEFNQKKDQLQQLNRQRMAEKKIVVAYKEVKNTQGITNDPFLKAIADREEDIRNDVLATIIFVRLTIKNSKGRVVEVSGYIDLSDRLNNEDFIHYYEGRQLLIPRKSDLSFFNWNTGVCVFNDSRMFKNEADVEKKAVGFKNKRDRRIIWVDSVTEADNYSVKRTEVQPLSSVYKQVIFFDQMLNIKTF